MLRHALARLGRVLDLARLFDLPDNHPDRMIAASIMLYIGFGVIIIACRGVEQLERGISLTVEMLTLKSTCWDQIRVHRAPTSCTWPR